MSTATQAAISSTPRSSRIELVLSHIDHLPALPAVAARLLEFTASNPATPAEAAGLMETDPALGDRVLRLIRAVGAAAGEVAGIESAIGLLGFEAVRHAVLCVQVYGTFMSAELEDETSFDRAGFWNHSMGVACAARLITSEVKLPALGIDAFACGLLHDLGKIALDACLPKSYARAIRDSRSTGRCLCDVERGLLGIDHTVAGKRLAVRWKLPASIVDCIWLHHQPPHALPESLSSAILVQIVHLADALVRQQGIGCSGYQPLEPFDLAAQAVGLAPAAVRRIGEALPAEIKKHCAWLGIHEESRITPHAKALANANAQLARINATLAETNRHLKERSHCYEGLCRFIGTLTLDHSVADVGLAAARCLREALGVGAAVGFSHDLDGSCYHLGIAQPSGDRVETVVSPSLGARKRENLNSRCASAPLREISSLDGIAEPIIRQCEEALGLGPYRMLGIHHARVALGGVLIPCQQADSVADTPPAQELAALSVAFGLAMAGAADRLRTRQLSEEMADANRRLHQAQGELLRTRSLAAIAAMAAGAAHELNNPLAVIGGRAQMLADGVKDPKQRKAARIIQDQAERASELVTELIQFANPEPAQAADIPLRPWLDELRRRWERSSSLRRGQIVVTLSDPNLAVYADAGQLQRVFDALLANAIEATIPATARVKINSASLSSDDLIVVIVEDNGVGMSPEVLQHAADPFFSHRTAGRGRGMGLSHAVRLAANNGGRLWLSSTADVGTVAHVELPARRPPKEPS